MAMNYQACLSYLDFEDTEFTEEQQEEIKSRYDMYYILSQTEYQMKYIAKMLMRGDSDKDIFRYLGIRIRHVNQHIPRPPHINHMLKLPKSADITIIFKESLKDDLEALDEVCKKSPYYRAYPPVSLVTGYSSDYNDYALLPEEEKKNRKLSYYPVPEEVREINKRKRNDALNRMKSHFDTDNEYKPIEAEKLDPDVVREEHRKNRKASMLKYFHTFATSSVYKERREIILELIDKDRMREDVMDALMNVNVDYSVVEYAKDVILSRKLSYDDITTIIVSNMDVSSIKTIINLISGDIKNYYMRNKAKFRQFICICAKYGININDITTHLATNIDKIVLIDKIYYSRFIHITPTREKYISSLIENVNDYTIDEIRLVGKVCDVYADINLIDIIEIYRLSKKYIPKHAETFDRIYFNAIVGYMNGVSINSIEYCLKHCDHRGGKMWTLIRMAEHNIDMDNYDIDHIVFGAAVDSLLDYMYNENYPIEIILKWFEGLVNKFGVSHRNYSMNDLSSYMDDFIRYMNDDFSKFITSKHIRKPDRYIGMALRYLHIAQMIGLNYKEVHGKMILCTNGQYRFDDAFNIIDNMAANCNLKYHYPPSYYRSFM